MRVLVWLKIIFWFFVVLVRLIVDFYGCYCFYFLSFRKINCCSGLIAIVKGGMFLGFSLNLIKFNFLCGGRSLWSGLCFIKLRLNGDCWGIGGFIVLGGILSLSGLGFRIF